jgi:hypothetical protein
MRKDLQRPKFTKFGPKMLPKQVAVPKILISGRIKPMSTDT